MTKLRARSRVKRPHRLIHPRRPPTQLAAEVERPEMTPDTENDHHQSSAPMKDAAEASMETTDISLASSTGADSPQSTPAKADRIQAEQFGSDANIPCETNHDAESDHFLTISFLDDKNKATAEKFPEKAFVDAMAGSWGHGDHIREQYCKHHRY
ncbi:hypothetical protein PAAG_05622 [Paracoccidioides lutzii Pb01]|uniref:Uncharacterized protein n=1 Tax=Paracoccidioides lutzii (strain ATCC MYA-826 / Pb01) TaxID=502779 RepID=C1H4C9_PARBA|nr:hypothetical protein PAAG_05622 [Paracoccidioides lutzii Pb01]EEH34573.2 hypothetical protein PAAG_05622 [Paracoccidioides lutzii Pb01]